MAPDLQHLDAAAFVVARREVPVAKHGNRAACRAGSIDVLEALGVNVEMPVEAAASCSSRSACSFFARIAHPPRALARPVRGVACGR
jgi:anthranilate phosphoribosyltransferase